MSSTVTETRPVRILGGPGGSVASSPDDPATVVLSGHIGAGCAARLRDALSTALRSAADRLLVDVSQVRSMDVPALRALIAGRRLAATAGVELVLVEPSSQFTTLLAGTGLLRTFRVGR